MTAAPCPRSRPRHGSKLRRRTCSSIIRSFDPNHLISLGTLGGGQCGAQGDDYQTVMSVPTLDLCEYHDYQPAELVPGDQFNGLQRRIDQCNALRQAAHRR